MRMTEARMETTFFLKSPEDTMLLGRMLAQAMCAGHVDRLYLRAPLGGGKTTLARGFAAALPGGEGAEVASPSFTLCNEYPTLPCLVHADLYRLPEHSRLPEEVEDALEGGGMLLLEWPERLQEDSLDRERLELSLEPCRTSGGKYLDKENKTCETVRAATLRAYGDNAEALAGRLLPELCRRFSG